jgi:zinc/manganese transport system substrate-binding protein
VITVRKFFLFIMICMVAGLQACEQSDTGTDDRLRVLTTIAPLYSFTKNITGDAARVDNLLPSGAGPHEYSLSPADAGKVAETNLLIINGVNLEDWLHKLTSSAEQLRKSEANESDKLVVVDTSIGVELMDNDPHIWLSPKNAVIQAENIRDALMKADPDNAEIYSGNADEYILRLRELDKKIRDEVRTWKSKEFVAFHSAFTYFSRDYGLEQVAVIQETPEREPSPRHIAEVIEVIKSRDIRAIFTEPQFSHKIVTSLAGDLNLQVYSLDTLETGSLSKEWYVEKIRLNVSVLRKALKGGAE